MSAGYAPLLPSFKTACSALCKPSCKLLLLLEHHSITENRPIAKIAKRGRDLPKHLAMDLSCDSWKKELTRGWWLQWVKKLAICMNCMTPIAQPVESVIFLTQWKVARPPGEYLFLFAKLDLNLNRKTQRIFLHWDPLFWHFHKAAHTLYVLVLCCTAATLLHMLRNKMLLLLKKEPTNLKKNVKKKKKPTTPLAQDPQSRKSF